MAKKSAITYDIDLDFKILNFLVGETFNNTKVTISNLKIYLGIHSSRLEEHIQHLAHWNIINDKKPEKNGKARIISLAKDYDKCIFDLMKLKESIDRVNEYF